MTVSTPMKICSAQSLSETASGQVCGDLDHALAAYNWGQGNVDRHGLDNMPQETRNYVAKINPC